MSSGTAETTKRAKIVMIKMQICLTVKLLFKRCVILFWLKKTFFLNFDTRTPNMLYLQQNQPYGPMHQKKKKNIGKSIKLNVFYLFFFVCNMERTAYVPSGL